MKKLLLTAVVAASFSGVAFADTKNTQDMDALFQSTPATAKIEPLSTQEMKATEGKIIPVLVVGAALGGIQYGASCVIARNCTLAGAGFNMAAGAALGGAGGTVLMSGARVIFSTKAALGFGMANGVGTVKGWW
jgi:hypothetical protein